MPHRTSLYSPDFPDEPITMSNVPEDDEHTCKHRLAMCPEIKCGKKSHFGVCHFVQITPYVAVFWQMPGNEIPDEGGSHEQSEED